MIDKYLEKFLSVTRLSVKLSLHFFLFPNVIAYSRLSFFPENFLSLRVRDSLILPKILDPLHFMDGIHEVGNTSASSSGAYLSFSIAVPFYSDSDSDYGAGSRFASSSFPLFSSSVVSAPSLSLASSSSRFKPPIPITSGSPAGSLFIAEMTDLTGVLELDDSLDSRALQYSIEVLPFLESCVSASSWALTGLLPVL